MRSQAQVAEAHAAIEAAKSQVVEAQATLEAALATTERLKAEPRTASRRAPRSGRVQHRMAQPGEVLLAAARYSRSSISVMSI